MMRRPLPPIPGNSGFRSNTPTDVRVVRWLPVAGLLKNKVAEDFSPATFVLLCRRGLFAAVQRVLHRLCGRKAELARSGDLHRRARGRVAAFTRRLVLNLEQIGRASCRERVCQYV